MNNNSIGADKQPMMDYENYIKEIANRLQQALGSGYDVYIQTFCQNNGIKNKGIFISAKGSELAECLTADRYYGLCQTQQDLDLACRDMLNDYMGRKAYGFSFQADRLYEKNISKKFGSGFYMLPGSLHEVILIPSYTCNQISAKQLKHLVMSVNLKEIPRQDILSDTVYFYNKEDDLLSVVM